MTANILQMDEPSPQLRGDRFRNSRAESPRGQIPRLRDLPTSAGDAVRSRGVSTTGAPTDFRNVRRSGQVARHFG